MFQYFRFQRMKSAPQPPDEDATAPSQQIPAVEEEAAVEAIEPHTPTAGSTFEPLYSPRSAADSTAVIDIDNYLSK
ncbi:MAG: hypothetical protein R2795_04410 [Saprospiraceae bacterium]